MIYNMEKVLKNGKMVLFMMVNIIKEKNKEKEFIFGQTDQNMKEIGMTIKRKDL